MVASLASTTSSRLRDAQPSSNTALAVALEIFLFKAGKGLLQRIVLVGLVDHSLPNWRA